MGRPDSYRMAGSPVRPGDGDDAGRERYAGANVNFPRAMRRTTAGAIRPSAALRALLEDWSVESFQRERESLERARQRQALSVVKFVQALYRPEEEACRQLAALAVSRTKGPQDLARTLLGPAALVTGRDWEDDTADFLRVTMAMSRLQLLFQQSRTAEPPPPPWIPGRRMLLGPAPGNQHGFGLSVAEDAFERDGWLVDSGTSADQLLCLAGAADYQIIGLSIGHDRALPDLGSFAAALRARSRNKSAVLMAGGCLATRHPQLLLAAGFDLVSVDAAMAVRDAAAVATHRPSTPS